MLKVQILLWARRSAKPEPLGLRLRWKVELSRDQSLHWEETIDMGHTDAARFGAFCNIAPMPVSEFNVVF